MKTRRIIRSLVLAGILAVILVACADEGVVTGPDPLREYPEATTPEILFENFVKAYTERALEAYAVLLHQDFAFTFLPCDVQELGLKQDHYDRADELASAARMFSGKPHVREEGQVVPAITAIVPESVRQLTAWADAGDPQRPRIVRAVYDLRFRFERAEAGDLVVAGNSVFFAAPVSDPRGGERYRLIGWIDKTRACPD